MIEHEIRKKGLISAPAALDAAILRHARQNVEDPVRWLDNPWIRRAAGYVPFLDWGLMASAVLRGYRVSVTPALPGLIPVMFGLTTGDMK